MLVPNSTQTPNVIFDQLLSKLDEFPLKVLLVIVRKTIGWEADPLTGMRKEQDWIAYSQFQQLTGGQTQAISRALKILEDMELIEVRDSHGKILGRNVRAGKRLFYRLKTSLSNKDVASNLFVKQSLSNKDTKETNTKTLSKDNGGSSQKKTSCPLLNGSPLREKYPNGHTECVEYLMSEEEDRDQNFINRSKQFQVIHKILRAGYGFDVMDRTIREVEKKYGKATWDYSTLASWIEKGSSR